MTHQGEGSGRHQRPLLESLGRIFGAATILFVPVAFWPWNIAELFTPAKTLCVLVLGVPAAAMLTLARFRAPDPLHGFRLLLLPFIVLVSAIAAFKVGGFPHDIVPFLNILVLPLVFLEIGAAFGTTGKDRQRLFLLLGLSAIPVLLLGGAGRLLGWPALLEAAQHGGLPATIGNSNELSDFAAPLVPVALALALFGRGLVCGLGWACVAVTGALLVWSDSRGGMLALMAGLLVLLLAAWARARQQEALKPVVRFGLLVLVVVGIGAAATPGVRLRLASAFDPENRTVKVRAQIAEGTLEMIRDHPLGVGAGRFQASFPPYRKAEEWRISGTDSAVRDPHNEALWVVSECGVVGAVFLILLAILVYGTWRRSRSVEAVATERPFVAAALITTAVLCLYHPPFHCLAGALVPATLLGALAAGRGGGGGRQRMLTRFTGLAVLGTVAIIGALDLQAEQQLEEALNLRYDVALMSSDADKIDSATLQKTLAELTVALGKVNGATIKSARRSWSAQRIVLELLPLRRQIEATGRAMDSSHLPDAALHEALLEEVLRLSPDHATAHSYLAELDLNRGRYADAIYRLTDAIKRTPAAPRLRVNLAITYQHEGEVGRSLQLINEEIALYRDPPLELRARRGRLSLRLGTDRETTGFYLRPPLREGLVAEMQQAEALLAAGNPSSAQTLVLAHLGDHPACPEALNFISSLGFGEMRQQENALQEASHAVARSKLLTAADLERSGELRLALRNLNLVPQKDGALNDVALLRARIAARRDDLPAVLRALQTLMDRGFRKADLVPHLETHDGLRNLLEAGRLSPALGN